MNMLFGAALASWMSANFPGVDSDNLLGITAFSGGVIAFMVIPLQMALFAGFGALAGPLGMQFFFKTRIHRP
ncbi:MAG: hypothetical protein LBB40_03440 [Holophagales bacterium]|jgi:hypothetical protein|nr:hypothetical protein [Holophagales bacterium]